MSSSAKYLHEARRRRHRRVRKKIRGTEARPRLAVYRSNRHISAQVIDDRTGRTLATATSTDAELGGDGANGNVATAKLVGSALAERAKAAGITKVVFDRGGFQYHGRVAALADAAREAGLEF